MHNSLDVFPLYKYVWNIIIIRLNDDLSENFLHYESKYLTFHEFLHLTSLYTPIIYVYLLLIICL